jgi:hypothetical protein
MLVVLFLYREFVIMSKFLVFAAFATLCLLTDAGWNKKCYQCMDDCNSPSDPGDSYLTKCVDKNGFGNVGCGFVKYYSTDDAFPFPTTYVRICAPADWDAAAEGHCIDTVIPGYGALHHLKCICSSEGCNKNMDTINASFGK